MSEVTRYAESKVPDATDELVAWRPPVVTCLAHLLPEPCPTCAAYIAGGL